MEIIDTEPVSISTSFGFTPVARTGAGSVNLHVQKRCIGVTARPIGSVTISEIERRMCEKFELGTC